MKTAIVALAMFGCLFTALLQAADAAAEFHDAESYCARQADREQVPGEARAEFIADCKTDRIETLQSDEGDAIEKGAGHD